MNIKIYQDRKLLNETDNFGSQHENLATTLIFEFPEYVEKDGIKFATKDLNKTIIFDIEGDNELPIENNKFSFPYEITKLGEVVWNIALKEKSETEDMTDKLIWYSETMKSTFIKTNEGHNEITTEKIDSFNVVITTLNNKITEVEKLKVEIGDFQKALNSKVDKKQGYDLSQNDFTNILKEKLENLENYNDEDIRKILNGSLKGVNYTASNGILTFVANDGTKIEVDLPLELLVKSGRYDEENKQIVLILANGNVINIPVSDLLDAFYGKEKVDKMLAERDAKISDLEKENSEQQDEINDLYNEFEKGTAEGDNIYIDDSSDLKMKLIPYGEPVQEVIEEELGTTVEGESVVVSDGDPNKEVKDTIYGMSKQETTEGYQLLDESKITVNDYYAYNVASFVDNLLTTTVLNDGETATNVSLMVNNDIPLEDGDYYVSCDARLVSGKGEVNSLQMTRSGTSEVSVSNISKPTPTNVFQRYIREYTISNAVDAKAVTFLFQLINTENAVFEATNFQISKVNKPYEPYTGGISSPNMNYKQPIEEITEARLVQRGKNLVKISNFEDISCGITSSNIGKHKIKFSGTITQTWCNLKNTYYDFSELEAGTYTVTVKNLPKDSIMMMYARYEDGTIAQYLNVTNRTITISQNIIAYRFYLSDVAIGTVFEETILEFQIEKGEVATEIEPPIEPIVKEIDLAGNSIAKVGEIKDLLNIGVDGSVSIEKNTTKDIEDGTNHFGVSSETDTYIQFIGLRTGKNYSEALCNKFFAINTDDRINKSGIVKFNDNNLRISLLKKDFPDITSTELFINFLKENNLEIYSLLEIPETINLPLIEPIELFEGTNIFELVTNLGTTMALTYNYVTPSPSIDRPSEILTVKGSYDTELVNENLVVIDNLETNWEYTNNGIKNLKRNENTIFATSKAKKGDKLKINFIAYSKPTTATTFATYINGTQNIDASIMNFNKYNLNQIYTKELEIIEDTELTIKMFGNSNEETFEFALWVNKNEVEDYTKHQGNTLPLTLTNELLGEIVTLSEEEATALNLDGAGKYRNYKYNRHIFTGDENISLYGTVDDTVRFDIYNLFSNKINSFFGIYCNYLKNENSNLENTIRGGLDTFSHTAVIYVNKSVASTVDELKAWLKSLYEAGNPMEVIYELATPTYEKITDETELAQLAEFDKEKSFYPITNIYTYSTDKLEKAPLKIRVEYYKSNKTINAKQNSKLSNLEERIIALESETVNS